MRVAIFSDVHGNLTALEAVLADIKQHAPDLTVFAGDLCYHGPRPSECIARLRQEAIACLYGNTDMAVRDPTILSRQVSAVQERRSEHIDDLVEWTWAQMSELDRAWLRSLPFQRSVAPSVNPRDDLLIVHANPLDTEQPIQPPEELQRELFGEVRQPDEDAALRNMLKDKIIAVLAFGHVHIPSIRHWGDVTLANISSVSLALDRDTRAKYGLLTWDKATGWDIAHQYVEYDLEQEIELLAQMRPPEWQQTSYWLRTGRDENLIHEGHEKNEE
jgi:predicted phosphodiesterase